MYNAVFIIGKNRSKVKEFCDILSRELISQQGGCYEKASLLGMGRFDMPGHGMLDRTQSEMNKQHATQGSVLSHPFPGFFYRSLFTSRSALSKSESMAPIAVIPPSARYQGAGVR